MKVDYDNVCVKLENYIKWFTPSNWKETIQTATFVPFVDPIDYAMMKKGIYPDKFNSPYFIEAIKAYFESNN
jgi:hypothetical protein